MIYYLSAANLSTEANYVSYPRISDEYLTFSMEMCVLVRFRYNVAKQDLPCRSFSTFRKLHVHCILNTLASDYLPHYEVNIQSSFVWASGFLSWFIFRRMSGWLLFTASPRMIKKAWARFLVIKSSVTSGCANIMPWREGTNQCHSWQVGSDQLK